MSNTATTQPTTTKTLHDLLERLPDLDLYDFDASGVRAFSEYQLGDGGWLYLEYTVSAITSAQVWTTQQVNNEAPPMLTLDADQVGPMWEGLISMVEAVTALSR